MSLAASNKIKEAAAVILLRQNDLSMWEIYWARRSMKMSFMSGYHAFPGGRLDPEDFEIEIKNVEDSKQAALCICAIREVFEETAVLLCPNSQTVSREIRLNARQEIMRGDLTFADFLRNQSLQLDAAPLVNAGRWITPPYAPRRFDTNFFVTELSQNEVPELWADELENGEWISSENAIKRWSDSDVVIAPPILHALRSISKWTNSQASLNRDWNTLNETFLSIPQASGNPTQAIEVRPGILCFPLVTVTLPPATHTNCYIVGEKELIVIDPASADETEQARLNTYLENFCNNKEAKVKEIWLTHHHPDHVSGANAARDRWRVPIAAHRKTADLLKGKIEIDRFIENDSTLTLEGNPGWQLRAILTPGHAPGHLCFLEEKSGSIITGDMIVGMGSVLINPPDGNMKEYLDSLHFLMKLPIKTILGGHGPALNNPYYHLKKYVEHRLEREENILKVLKLNSPQTPKDIVKIVYAATPENLRAMAERSVLAHLEKLEKESKVEKSGSESWTTI